MTGITFKRIAPDESRIYDSTGCIIGEIYRQDDILKPGSHYFVVHLSGTTAVPTVSMTATRSARRPCAS